MSYGHTTNPRHCATNTTTNTTTNTPTNPTNPPRPTNLQMIRISDRRQAFS
ncbi:predicted protein [Plenodomus lingam JN3]|uniref:Predicted protein n=1 Tax=Leptosphaeria maculans (strain JN3 / isolate v23.1.3 / race Av1-4-5-6-7-8) TaxID=985895 RepID=E4ZNK6_LEPMJ|nr:predicted protein [Plenodomus lingam JN3]CBX93065.1 predicted protein [Plenodomus lingam JN3]